jgi:hypothetical protein
MWAIKKMEALATENGEAFPPTDYWSRVPEPERLRYGQSRRKEFTKNGLSGVPVDDDVAYTLLGLLIMEEHGPAFTTEDAGKAWLKYLPHACTAEDVTLRNLKRGVPARRAGSINNPYREWIGADIRADPWGYLAPGWPERAAELAYEDAYISHRRQGIYGAMFFAREAVDSKYDGMHRVHTVNNACLTVFGLTIGGNDFSRVIGETVAMGLDNDCTAATAGSIAGAVLGEQGIPAHWSRNFNNTVHSYLIGKRRFSITGLLRRFEIQARRVHRSSGNSVAR